MLPKGIIQKNNYFAYRALCAVIHVVWITAFLSLIAFEKILYGRVFFIQAAVTTRFIHDAVPRL